MKSAKQHLQAARKLIARPEAWTRGTYGRGPDRKAARIGTDEISCWCLIGAIKAVDPDNSEEAMEWLRLTLRYEYGDFISISHFNDTHSHQEILAALDRAIEATN
ncbi:hypothetical protein GJW-30_1_04418 [Variibacter gotjawalensis]|uniref:Uncharacterized protein n=1 Tax=Variibacter gotjawalensis TaxID=1333996 RepID=A0A0S3Q1I4_9BRAD|nr:hypothetical protein [Variibacter gotjawalensis]RZS49593.1 hypothetical protein EV661_2029 [Variibacter gotjawalensis]BAT61856.1 hypothetical protein GJW-30_1_04418 [Variibacter gotjawalensis]